MFQWTGGVMDLGNGDLTNLGTMTITALADFYNDGILYNYGTIIQSGSGDLQLGTDGTFPSTLVNEAGAYYLLEGSGGLSEISDSGYAPGQTSLSNAGIIRKTAGSGTSSLSVLGSITNTGTIEADSGTIALSAYLGISQLVGDALIGGTWSAVDGAELEFPSGTAITNNEGTLTLSGAGAQIAGIAGLASNSGAFFVTNGAAFTTAAGFTNSGSLTVGPGSTVTVAGCLYPQTLTGTLDDQIGGTPASGQFGRLKVAAGPRGAGIFDLAAGRRLQSLVQPDVRPGLVRLRHGRLPELQRPEPLLHRVAEFHLIEHRGCRRRTPWTSRPCRSRRPPRPTWASPSR